MKVDHLKIVTPEDQEGLIDDWLETLAASAPEAPVIPLEALRRENLYE